MITFIGDVHCKKNSYLNLIKNYEYTIQIGDFDFNYSHLLSINSDYHKMIPGNHDNHNAIYSYSHCLGRYGKFILNNISGFFVGGGYSIDKEYRKTYVNYWPNEELNFIEMKDCYNQYIDIKPELMVTHEPPLVFKQFLINKNNIRLIESFGLPSNFNSNTSDFLESLFEIHKPKIWICGHFHIDKTAIIDRTTFICLNELSTITIGENYEILRN